MSKEGMDLDGLHSDDNELETPIIESELENDDDDDDAIETPASEVDEPGNDDEPAEGDEPELTGTEKFLSQYGIVGGMIEFEGGDKKHYDELTHDEQFNVLKSIAESGKTSIEQEYGLDGEEIALLNYARQNQKSLSEVVRELVDEQVEKVTALKGTATEDFTTMSTDAVYAKWLMNADPEATEQDILDGLEAAKASKTYEKAVENIRKGFIQDQERMIQVEENMLEQERLKELEADRETIVNEVSSIDYVAGWDVSDDQKNEVLGSLLEVNSHGDSLFMERVFSDPKKLFEVAWLEKYGNQQFDTMAEYYKNEINLAYKKGRQEAVSGLPARPITSASSSDGKKGKTSTPATREENNAPNWGDIHTDND